MHVIRFTIHLGDTDVMEPSDVFRHGSQPIQHQLRFKYPLPIFGYDNQMVVKTEDGMVVGIQLHHAQRLIRPFTERQLQFIKIHPRPKRSGPSFAAR